MMAVHFVGMSCSLFFFLLIYPTSEDKFAFVVNTNKE